MRFLRGYNLVSMKALNTIKEILAERENSILSEFAQKSSQSKGRACAEELLDYETEYQHDKNRILHCKAFRRLKHKTQVFFAPNNDHYRTRLTHTLEVSQLARTMARALALNEDLAEAIALGHDLGHTPFGHTGEYLLNEIMIEGFRHSEQSVRIVKHLEKLNLTHEVIDGILTHNGNREAITLEGKIVRFADKIAYINHDIDDAIRAGVIREKDLPEDCQKYFSLEKNTRTNKMIYNIIETSWGKDDINMSEECFYYFNKMKSWMFENVYFNQDVKYEEGRAKRVVKELFYFYLEQLQRVTKCSNEISMQRCVCDYVSGMSDRYAIQKYNEHFMPKFVQKENNDDYLFALARESGLI